MQGEVLKNFILVKMPAYLRILFLLIICAALFACDESEKAKPPDPLQQLSEEHCGSCHKNVDPSMLTKKIWSTRVLPAMASRMGIGVWQDDQYYDRKDGKATISMQDWDKLVDYYVSHAPDSLVADSSTFKAHSDWAIFKLRKPHGKTQTGFSTTTMVKLDTSSRMIFTGNGHGELMRWDSDLAYKDSMQMRSPPVDVNGFKAADSSSSLLITCIGSLNAIDVASGEVWEVSDKPFKRINHVAINLPRPVESIPIDIDRDEKLEYIVCGFGHEKGSLFLLHVNADGQYDRTVLSDIPGATKVEVTDYNHDGWQDLLVLFAQAREGVWLFLNDQQGGFTSKNLIEFPPVYGSTSFQFVDMNKDGLKDIVYTCGDNADYSPILKPFHGIYIFINTGNDLFQQDRFYHIDGCMKAIVADFDKDGDMDLAAIAFFQDFSMKPSESMLYFEQTQQLEFSIHSIPISLEGRWICEDVGDFDRDGDLDIILGNYSRGFGTEGEIHPNWNTSTPFIVLENLTP